MTFSAVSEHMRTPKNAADETKQQEHNRNKKHARQKYLLSILKICQSKKLMTGTTATVHLIFFCN